MAATLSQLLLPLLAITLLYSSHLVNGQENCTNLLDRNVIECGSCSPGRQEECYRNCNNTSSNMPSECMDGNSTDDITCEVLTCNRTAEILGLPLMTFIIIVAAAAGGLLVLLLCTCLCCCCYCHRRKKRRLENLKHKLIEQPDVDTSPSRYSNTISPIREPVNPVQAVQSVEPSIEMQINEALRRESSPGVPPSSLTELVPLSTSSSTYPKSRSTDNIRESAMSDTAVQPKTNSDAYLKMTVRPSKSCQDFAEDEEIYVEPDQNLHQSIDAVVPTTAHTLPKKDKPAQPRPPVAQKPENPYGNQGAIDELSKASIGNEGYANVVPPPDNTGESYTSVSEFLHGHTERNIEDDEEEDAREYYNFLPGGTQDDEMYVYMQSGIAGTQAKPSSDQDRKRSRSGPNSNSIKYMNLSAQEKMNHRLPGSEYGEPGEGLDTTEDSVKNGVCHDGGEQPIYANCNTEEELYTAMS